MSLIFQRGPDTIRNFNVNGFRFLLVQLLPEEDIYAYHISRGDFCMLFLFGADTSSRCRFSSNVDFVHFVWDNLERYSIKKYAINLLPSEDAPTPPRLHFTSPTDTRLPCLKYYRAASGGWGDSADSEDCISQLQLSLSCHSGCRWPSPATVIFADDNLPPYVICVHMSFSMMSHVLN